MDVRDSVHECALVRAPQIERRVLGSPGAQQPLEERMRLPAGGSASWQNSNRAIRHESGSCQDVMDACSRFLKVQCSAGNHCTASSIN